MIEKLEGGREGGERGSEERADGYRRGRGDRKIEIYGLERRTNNESEAIKREGERKRERRERESGDGVEEGRRERGM